MKQQKNYKALETGSGITWSEWLVYLAPHAKLNHAEMAKAALKRINDVGKSKSPEWWAQGVTIAYEQHIGRRTPGQRSDGNYSVTVNKTVAGNMSDVLAKIIEKMHGVVDFGGVAIYA